MAMEMNKEKILDAACKLGRNILENGGEVYRVEESVNFFLEAYGIVGAQIFTLQSCIIVTYKDENHVTIGPYEHKCTGPRTHVSSTGQIKDFHLLYHFLHDRKNRRYLLVGCVGQANLERLRALDKRIEEGHLIF